MFDIVALGEALIDFSPNGKNELGYPLFSENPGGAPANVLAMASKLGAKTCFIGKVGDDIFGHFLSDHIKKSGVGIEGLVMSKEYPTTLAFVSLDEKGDRSFCFFRNRTADVMLEKDDVKEDILSSCRIFHFGSVSMSAAPSRDSTIYAVGKAKSAGAIISYDPNYRPLLWKREDEAKEVMSSAIPYADILKVSDEELRLLSGTDDDVKGSEMLSKMGPAVVMVTRGADGSFIRIGDYTKFFRTFSVNTVDTTGAGDAFVGVLLFELVLKNNVKVRNELFALSPKKIDEAMIYGNAAGSLTTTGNGAIPSMPSFSMIEECIKGKI